MVVLGASTLLVTGCLGDPPQAGAACPGDPTAEAGPQGDIHLSWQPVPDAKSYPILRSGPDATQTLVANASGATTSYTDPSAQRGTTYRYTVHSWNGTARSVDCPVTEVAAVPFLPGPAAAAVLGGLVALGMLILRGRGRAG